MQVIVITTPPGLGSMESTRKITDLAKPGNCKWLMSHIKWAAENRHYVSIHPKV